jgi:hypothetical protein
MYESTASRQLREAGQATREAASWANPLSRTGRRQLAAKLARASERYGFKDRDGTYSPSRVMASAECSDLHLDVTERAAVPTS